VAPQTLQALRSLSQSITWGPLELRLRGPQSQSIVQEVCAALDGNNPLAQAVSKLTLHGWQIETPIAALCAWFPNVLHFELGRCLRNCLGSIASEAYESLLSEAIAVWPRMLECMN